MLMRWALARREQQLEQWARRWGSLARRRLERRAQRDIAGAVSFSSPLTGAEQTSSYWVWQRTRTRAQKMVLVVDAGSVLSFLPSLAAGAGDGTDRERVAGAGVDLFAMGTTAGCNGAAPAAGSTAVFLGSTAAGCNCAAPAAGSTAGGADSTAAGCNGAAPAAGSTAGGVIPRAVNSVLSTSVQYHFGIALNCTEFFF